jgi:mannose-6-phosphate isomerase-like protein (cupin superfamily)
MDVVMKPWGHESIYVNNERYCLKRLNILIDEHTSIHKHLIKDETLVVEHGSLCYEIFEATANGKVRLVNSVVVHEGGCIRVSPGTIHRLINFSSSSDLLLLEASTHHDDSDTVRYKEELVELPDLNK